MSLDPTEGLFAFPGDVISVTCYARGNPTPEIAWDIRERDGEKITDRLTTEDAVFSSNETAVSAAIVEGAASHLVFKCEGRNNEGRQVKTLEAKLIAPGSPPRSIKALSRGNTVDVTWEEPQKKNVDISGYEVLYTLDPEEAMENWGVKKVSGDERVATVENLEEDSNYHFRLRALGTFENFKDTRGPLSEIITAKTTWKSKATCIFRLNKYKINSV